MPFGNILFVGGSGSFNYTNIQDEVDDAEAGDTVFVFDIYHLITSIISLLIKL